jgi:hypothetical protein
VTCHGWDVGVTCEAKDIDGADVIDIYVNQGSNNPSGGFLARVRAAAEAGLKPVVEIVGLGKLEW